VILTFDIAYETSSFPLERHRIQLAACYQLLCYTGARPVELVEAERKGPKNGSIEKLFGRKVVQSAGNDDKPNETGTLESAELCELLLQENTKRGRPKALCWEDIMMMLVRHPVTEQAVPVMAIKFIHHKGADNKPKP
jgi:hypothetical protein